MDLTENVRLEKRREGYEEAAKRLFKIPTGECCRQSEVWQLKGQQEERGSRGLTKGLKEAAEGNEETTVRLKRLSLASHFLFCEELRSW